MKKFQTCIKNFNIDAIGLRLFTVYGPYGRPDMYIPKILDKIKKGEIIEVYNNGKNLRDFTYVEDVSDIIKNLVINFSKAKSSIFSTFAMEKKSIF